MRALIVAIVLAIPASASAGNAVAYGDSGLRVGANVLYKAKVDGAAYDPAMDLVWFTSKGSLQVLDLRVAGAKPVVIVKKLANVGFMIVGPSLAEWNSAYTAAYLVLDASGKKPKIRASEGAYGPVDQDATNKLKKKIKKAKLVGQKFLKTLAKRPLRSITIPTPAEVPKVTMPADMCHVDDSDICGSGTTFGNTAYHLLVTEYTCGDACYDACVLYDPKSKKFADPDNSGAWAASAESGSCDSYGFDDDGKSYVSGSMHCTIDKGVTCTDDTPWSNIGIAP
jgi:hypothetical protein